MKQFLVVQHTYSEFLGGIEKQLENRGIGFNYFRPFTGQSLPAGALQYDALWLLGGAYAVTDHEHCPWWDDELKLITAFRRARRPVVGLGAGGLLVAQAAGGFACAQPAQRAYWTTARATASGRDDPVAVAADGRKVLVMVNGRVELPPAVTPILTDESGEWIAIRDGELAYGMLFRPELKPGMVEDMIMEEGRPLPDNIGEVLEQARAQWQESQRTTDRIAMALVAALDLMRERRKMPVFMLNPVQGEEK
ncbi:MAG: type 1 glutamine amidotransferase [Burkholderiales bacterium]